MPNIAKVLKDEIQRLARKEVKVPSRKLHESTRGLRRALTQFKRRVDRLERELRRLIARQGQIGGPARCGRGGRDAAGPLYRQGYPLVAATVQKSPRPPLPSSSASPPCPYINGNAEKAPYACEPRPATA